MGGLDNRSENDSGNQWFCQNQMWRYRIHIIIMVGYTETGGI